MKTITLLLTLVSLNSYPLEFKTKIICKEKSCEKETQIKGIKEAELKLLDLAHDKCLIKITSEKFYRIMEVDQKSKKIILLQEISENVIERSHVFFDSIQFDRTQKLFPCEQIPGVLGDKIKLDKCLAGHGKAFKYFCEKERIRNF